MDTPSYRDAYCVTASKNMDEQEILTDGKNTDKQEKYRPTKKYGLTETSPDIRPTDATKRAGRLELLNSTNKARHFHDFTNWVKWTNGRTNGHTHLKRCVVASKKDSTRLK